MFGLSAKATYFLVAVFTVVVVAISAVLGVFVFAGWDKYDKYNINKVASLEFSEGEDEFRILQLTDTHIKSVDQLDYMKRSVQELIDNSNPHLIVITGDGIWAGKGRKYSNTKAVLKEYVKLMDSFEIPWTYTFGNHDFEGNAKAVDYIEAFKSAKYCVFDNGPAAIYGNSNHFVNIKNGKDVVFSVGILDSNANRKYKDTIGNYDHIRDNQVAWYEWNIKGVSKYQYGEYDPTTGKVVSSILFYHIPQYEFYEERLQLLDEIGLNVENANGEIATETDDLSGKDSRLYPGRRSKLIETAVALGSTKAMFVGHLHRDRSVYDYKGVKLVQGTKTLTTSFFYGNEASDSANVIGGTVVSIAKDGSYTWQREISSIVEPEYAE